MRNVAVEKAATLEDTINRLTGLPQTRAELEACRRVKRKSKLELLTEYEKLDERAKEAHARKLHRQEITRALERALQALDYEPTHARSYIKDLLPSDKLNKASLTRAHTFLGSLLKQWKDAQATSYLKPVKHE